MATKAVGVEVPAYKPSSRLSVSQEQAADITVGEEASFVVKGRVKGVTEDYDGKGWSVELEAPEVVEVTNNKADAALKELSR